MRDTEHLAVLRAGAEAWNEWRDRHPVMRPDLGGVSLAGAKLGGALLAGADSTRSKPGCGG